MSDISGIALASAEQAAIAALGPIAAELGITDLAGIKNLSDLFKQWKNNTREVSAWALLDMAVQADAMAMDGQMGKAFAEFGSTKAQLIYDKLFEAALIFGDEFANDPELQAALVNLDFMQTNVLPFIRTFTEIYISVEKTLVKLEPYMPYIELVARAMRIFLFPPEGTAFGNDSFNLAMKELAKVQRLLYADLKKWMSEQTFPVPEVLMGLADGILDPSYSMDKLVDDYFEEENIGDVDLNWLDANGDFNLMNVSNFLLGDNPGTWAVNTLSTIDLIYSRYGVAALSWFSNFYENLLKAGLLESHDVVKSPLTLSDIKRFSKDITDLLTLLDNQGYTSSTMIRIASDKLSEDGAIIDFATLHYDEKATELGGTSLRKRFYDLNNTITNYHEIIHVLKGETRFNITEKIPVIDFFDNTFSLQDFYEDVEHTEVSTLDPEVDIDDLYNTELHTFHSAIINLSLKKDTAFEEIFYHPDYLNLVVDSHGKYGPPFLAGKFGTVDERDNNDKIVSWEILDEVDEAVADNPSAIISEGTYYNKAFLDDSGYYILNPLTTVNPSYKGYATELKAEVEAAVSTFKTTYGVGDWDNEDVLQISEASYKDMPGVHRLEVLGDFTTTLAAWNAHISGNTFTVDIGNLNDLVTYTSVQRGRRDERDDEQTVVTRSYAIGLNQSPFEVFRAGRLNGFASATVTKVSYRARRLNTIEIRSPYDILREKYRTSNVKSSFILNKTSDHSFIYSATPFQRLSSTARVPARKKKGWLRKLFGRSRRMKTITIFSGEVQANDPTLYLVKKSPITNLTIGDGIFFYGKEGKVRKVMGFKILSADEFVMPGTIQASVSSGIASVDGNTKIINGTGCWVYKLEKLDLTVSGGFDYDPFCYPQDNFMIDDGGGLNYRWTAIQDLNSFIYRRGLPYETNGKYSAKITPNSRITVAGLNPMLGETTVAVYIKDRILARPLIQKASDDTTPVATLKDGTIIFDVLSRHANLIKNLPIAGSEVILKYKTKWALYAKTLKDLNTVAKFTDDMVLGLDNLFGDTYLDESAVEQDVPSWIEITDEEHALYVPDDLFAEITSHLTELLEGTGPGNYLFRIQDGALVGRKDGLYYQRYLVLNQRMNKYSGAMYHVTSLEKSSGVLDNTVTSINDKLDIIRYDLDALPIASFQKLIFINNKFIDSVKYDLVRRGIGDKCLLTCGTCHVKYVCPYYNEQEVILTMLNTEDTFSVYLKDNKLNLASSIIIDDDEKIEEYRKYHHPYSEINTGDVRLIDDLILDINKIQPIFINEEGVPHDNMGWINKARYGTISSIIANRKTFSNPSACSKEGATVISQDSFTTNKYLYDALFINDTETVFSYASGASRKVGNTTVRFFEANAITAFSSQDDIFLVSDDQYQPIYLGKLEDLGLEIQNPQVSNHYAQAYKNLADYENIDQAWRESYKFQGTVHVGRLRTKVKSELIGDGAYTQESILAGKPNIRNYINFLREVKIPIKNIQWTLNGKSEDIITAKKALPFFQNNVRLVNVQK